MTDTKWIARLKDADTFLGDVSRLIAEHWPDWLLELKTTIKTYDIQDTSAFAIAALMKRAEFHDRSRITAYLPRPKPSLLEFRSAVWMACNTEDMKTRAQNELKLIYQLQNEHPLSYVQRFEFWFSILYREEPSPDMMLQYQAKLASGLQQVVLLSVGSEIICGSFRETLERVLRVCNSPRWSGLDFIKPTTFPPVHAKPRDQIGPQPETCCQKCFNTGHTTQQCRGKARRLGPGYQPTQNNVTQG